MFKRTRWALLALPLLSGCSSLLAPHFELPFLGTPDDEVLNFDTNTLPFVQPTVLGSWETVSVTTTLPAQGWLQAYPLPRLPELWAEAEKGNPTLQVMAGRVTQARALAGLALAAQLPAVSAQGEASRKRSSPNQANRAQNFNVPTVNSYGANLGGSFELDLFGKLAGESKASRLEALATEDLQEDMRVAVSTELARTYVALLAATRVEQAWQRLLAAEEQRLALVTARYEVGEVDVSTWQQAAANVQQQRSQALAAAANTRQLHYALSTLLGRAPQLIPVSAEELLALEHAPPQIGNISATVLLQRPDVRAAANVLAAANQRIGAARAAFLPQVSLNATAGFAGPVWSDVFTWNNRTWSAGPVVSLPIFQGGAIRANLRRSWGAYEEAVGNYRGTVLGAMQEAADTVTTNALAGEQANSAKQAYVAIGRSVAATEARFKAGDVGRYEALGATVAAAQAEVAYAQAQAGWHVATLRVVSALGGDWRQQR